MFQVLTNTGEDKHGYVRATVNLEFAGEIHEIGRISGSGTTQGKFDHEIITVKLYENLDQGIRHFLINSRSGYNFDHDTIRIYPQDYELI